MKIDITSPSDHDLKKLVQLWESSVRATHHFLTEEDIDDLKPIVASDVLPSLQLRTAVDDSGQILGFMGISGTHLEALFILPEMFGKGIGKMLVAHAIDHFHIATVDVNEDNAGALGFYQHLGFQVVDRSPYDPLGNPFPVLHMERQTSFTGQNPR